MSITPTQLPWSIKSVSSSRSEVWQDLFSRNTYRLILIALLSFRSLLIDSHISFTTFLFFKGGLLKADLPSCIISEGKYDISFGNAVIHESAISKEEKEIQEASLWCKARESAISKRVHSRFSGISKMYAEGVRRGKIDMDDSVEEQLYDEERH